MGAVPGPSVAAAPDGFALSWVGASGPGGPFGDIWARRYVALAPSVSVADGAAGPQSDGNGVLEAGETVTLAPSWRNFEDAAVPALSGAGVALTGPGGPLYTITDTTADYGTIGAGAASTCTASGDCYAVQVALPATRPAAHWDAAFDEDLSSAQIQRWSVHLGDSFADVPRANPFYRFVETLLHRGVTGGCSTGTYCPADTTTRAQMSVFTLLGKEGAGFFPAFCGSTPRFADVPNTSPFCSWIEELARRGVVAGCGGGNFCPGAAVTRAESAVFVLSTLDPTLSPPACGTPVFGDVPAGSPFCRWIEELARRGVVAGCAPGLYCPDDPVTRGQMAVFIAAGFGMSLYGP